MVLVDRTFTYSVSLMTIVMYCIFSINCNFCNKIATMNFQSYCDGSAFACACLAWQFVVQSVIFAVTLENYVKFLVICDHCPTNLSTFSLFTYCNSSTGSYFRLIL